MKLEATFSWQPTPPLFLLFFSKSEMKRENLETVQCYSNDGLSCYGEQ